METTSVLNQLPVKDQRILPVNPWQERLEKQGLKFNIPPRYTDSSQLPTDIIKIDDLTGLPTETSGLRHYIATELGDSIRDRREWAIIYGDVDNLKRANKKYTRSFGDMVIRYGQATIAQAINKIKFNPQVKVIVARASGAADETVAFISGYNAEELEVLKQAMKDAEKPIVIADPQFDFSLTTTVVDSRDPDIQGELVRTKVWLAAAEDRVPLSFYQQLEDRADTIVGRMKIAKDLARLPIEDLLNSKSITQFIDIIKDDLGDSRLSGDLLEVICKLTSIQATLAIKNTISNQAAYQLLLAELGTNEEKLRQAKTPEDLMAIFEDMFGSLTQTTP